MLSKYKTMSEHSLGEFEELVLLMVAAHNKEAYGVLLLEKLEQKLNKKVNVSAIHVALKRLENKGFVCFGITTERGGRREEILQYNSFWQGNSRQAIPASYKHL